MGFQGVRDSWPNVWALSWAVTLDGWRRPPAANRRPARLNEPRCTQQPIVCSKELQAKAAEGATSTGMGT